jgi:hypothetical protein
MKLWNVLAGPTGGWFVLKSTMLNPNPSSEFVYDTGKSAKWLWRFYPVPPLAGGLLSIFATRFNYDVIHPLETR